MWWPEGLFCNQAKFLFPECIFVSASWIEEKLELFGRWTTLTPETLCNSKRKKPYHDQIGVEIFVAALLVVLFAFLVSVHGQATGVANNFVPSIYSSCKGRFCFFMPITGGIGEEGYGRCNHEEPVNCHWNLVVDWNCSIDCTQCLCNWIISSYHSQCAVTNSVTNQMLLCTCGMVPVEILVDELGFLCW
jgi:hypothetical protein